MTLAPLLNAPIEIVLHTLAALTVICLTIALFTLPKGRRAHRVLGWIWVTLMATVAISGFWISEIQLWGRFSPIHLLSVLTLGSLVFNVRAARQHRVSAHAKGMKSLVLYALVVAGAFTFLPGRLMFSILTGG